MATGFAFKGTCYPSLTTAADAACGDTAFWNTTQGYHSSCKNWQYPESVQGWNRVQFNLMDAYGNMGSSAYIHTVNFPVCQQQNSDYAATFSLVVGSIVFVYLMSHAIGLFVKFIRDI